MFVGNCGIFLGGSRLLWVILGFFKRMVVDGCRIFLNGSGWLWVVVGFFLMIGGRYGLLWDF